MTNLKTEKIILNEKEYEVSEMSYADELNYLDMLDKNPNANLEERQEIFLSLVVKPFEKGMLKTLTREEGRSLSKLGNALNFPPSKQA
jgi:hypothetical protein